MRGDADDVRAELGQVVAGVRPGRRSDDETVIFDSTGMALEDVRIYLEELRTKHGFKGTERMAFFIELDEITGEWIRHTGSVELALFEYGKKQAS